MATGGGLGATGAGLAAAGGGPLPCTSVLRVHALVRGRPGGVAEEGSDGSIEAVARGVGVGCGGGGLGGWGDEPPNQPAKGFQPLPDCFVAGAEGLASLPQPCSTEAVRVGARGALGTVAILTKQEFLLPFIGGVFIIEALSVMIQVSYFKFTKKTAGVGKRVFMQAPLHHHFQLSGWKEPKIVFRFVIIAILFALLSLSTLKLR